MAKKPAKTFATGADGKKKVRHGIGRWVFCPASNLQHNTWKPCEVICSPKGAYFYVCSCGGRGFLQGWDDSLGYTIADLDAQGLVVDVSAPRRAELMDEIAQFKRRVNGRQPT